MRADGKFPIRGLLFCFVIVAICYANSIANDFILDDSLSRRTRTYEPSNRFIRSKPHSGVRRAATASIARSSSLVTQSSTRSGIDGLPAFA